MHTSWGRLLILCAIAFIALLAAVVFSSPVGQIPKYRAAEYFVLTTEITELRQLRESGDVPIGDYPALRLEPEVLKKLSPALANSPGVDPWGHPYRILVLPHSDQIGLYSVGKDGVSSSAGNDTDDIASWRNDSDAYYAPLESRRLWIRVSGVILILIGAVAILLATRAIQHRNKKIGQQVEDANAEHALG